MYCTLSLKADIEGAVIYDPGSSNGTKIRGVKLKKNVRCSLLNLSNDLYLQEEIVDHFPPLNII